MSATRILITAPTADVVTVSELKTMLGITTDADNDLLEVMIKAVVNQLDPAAGGWLGRALRPQTWELRLSEFPSDCIHLPYPPVTSVTSVKYDDSDGVEQTLTVTTDYRVFGLSDHKGASVWPPYNDSWPSARYDKESVRVRYIAGYDGDAMPQPIKNAVALGIRMLRPLAEKDLYLSREEVPGVRTREWVVSENASKALQRAMEGLLSTYRVWG